MARLIDIVDLSETIVAEPLLHLAHVETLAPDKADGVVGQRLARRHLLGQSLRVSNDKPQRLTVGDAVEGLGAEHTRRLVGLPILDVAFVARRQHRHSVVSRKTREVEIEIAGIVGRVTDHEQRSALGLDQRQYHRHRRPRQTIERRTAVASQRREGLGPRAAEKLLMEIVECHF